MKNINSEFIQWKKQPVIWTQEKMELMHEK